MSDDDTVRNLRPGFPLAKVMENPTEHPHRPLPPRYTPALHESIVRKISMGNNPLVAAAASGLPRYEFHAWRHQVEGGVAHPNIVKLFEDIEQAYATAEASAVETIATSEEDKTKNAQWFLEHSRAKDWGKREQLVITNEMEFAVNKLIDGMKDKYPEALEYALKLLSSG